MYKDDDEYMPKRNDVNFLKVNDLMKTQGNYKCHIYLGKMN